MFFDFFLFGTLWFWLLAFGAFVLITYVVESTFDNYDTDSGGGAKATATIIAFALIYYFAGSDKDVMGLLIWIKVHALHFILYVLGYYALGVIWSIYKWKIYLRKRASDIKAKLEEAKAKNQKLTSFYRLTAAENKSRITSWMSYWPFSAFWTLINKFVLQVWDHLYVSFEGVFKKIHKKEIGDLDEQIEKHNDEVLQAEIAERKRAEEERTNRRNGGGGAGKI